MSNLTEYLLNKQIVKQLKNIFDKHEIEEYGIEVSYNHQEHIIDFWWEYSIHIPTEPLYLGQPNIGLPTKKFENSQISSREPQFITNELDYFFQETIDRMEERKMKMMTLIKSLQTLNIDDMIEYGCDIEGEVYSYFEDRFSGQLFLRGENTPLYWKQYLSAWRIQMVWRNYLLKKHKKAIFESIKYTYNFLLANHIYPFLFITPKI